MSADMTPFKCYYTITISLILMILLTSYDHTCRKTGTIIHPSSAAYPESGHLGSRLRQPRCPAPQQHFPGPPGAA